MKRYKLIREYPGSPKLGKILKPKIEIENNNTNNYYWEGSWFNPENYPEFWQLMVEKDYEILKFILPGDNIIHIQNAKNSLEFMLKNHNTYKIYSIKRLSDGEIFTIGDLVGTPGSIYPLKEFKIIDSENTVAAHCYKNKIGGSGHYNYRLKNLKKAKQPLFTTEDGVDIFENDWYFRAATGGIVFDTISKYKASSKNAYPDNKYPDYHVNFSTKEAAEEYILLNKPCLSLKEIKENTTIKGLSLKKLQKLVQQKLNK